MPQGTKLGPITFQIIVNDGVCNSNTSCWKYVDDLTFAENRLCKNDSKLQVDLDDFLEWSETNQLKLNPAKCQAIQTCEWMFLYVLVEVTLELELGVSRSESYIFESSRPRPYWGWGWSLSLWK